MSEEQINEMAEAVFQGLLLVAAAIVLHGCLS